jgi:hypothetical protein
MCVGLMLVLAGSDLIHRTKQKREREDGWGCPHSFSHDAGLGGSGGLGRVVTADQCGHAVHAVSGASECPLLHPGYRPDS